LVSGLAGFVGKTVGGLIGAIIAPAKASRYNPAANLQMLEGGIMVN
jgi:hypothetical protein